jgi:type II secretory pathway pseudopilin PulG
MVRSRDERGSSLILFIAVVAVLAALAAALTALTLNVQANSRRDRQTKQAFTVSEAALDAGLLKLGQSWPTDQYTWTTWSTQDAARFRTQFDEAAFPNPSSGDFSRVIFYDNNTDINGDGKVDWHDADTDRNGVINSDDHPWDRDHDGFMWVEAQGAVGERAARLQAEVQFVPRENPVPANVAVASEGLVYSNSGKNPVAVEGWSPGDAQASIWSPVAVDPDVYDPWSIASPEPKLPPVVDSVIPPDSILDFIAFAQTHGGYYSGGDLPASVEEWEGVVVIQVTSTTKINGPNFGGGVAVQLNGDGVGENKKPGMLIVVGPNYPDGPPSGELDLSGLIEYYGLIYTDGFVKDNGTTAIHGMLAARSTSTDLPRSSVYLGGDRDVWYNGDVIQNLNNVLPAKARLVPNTWREVQPK